MKSILILFLLFINIIANAQTFSGGVNLGFNASQVDGDDLSGFHKLGLNASVMTFVDIAKNISTSLELQFSQKGSQSGFSPEKYSNSYRLKTDYLELPLMLHFTDKGGMQFSGGISYSRLINYREFVDKIELDYSLLNKSESPKKQNFNYILGISYFMTSKVSISIRFDHSIKAFRYSTISNYPNFRQVHRLVSVRLQYIFRGINIQRHKKQF